MHSFNDLLLHVVPALLLLAPYSCTLRLKAVAMWLCSELCLLGLGFERGHAETWRGLVGVLDNQEGMGFSDVMGALKSALGLVESAVGAEVGVLRKEAGGKLLLDVLLEDLRGRDGLGGWQV